VIINWIIGQPHHHQNNGVMAWVCGHPNLLTFECLDSSLSLYFLVYDFLWGFLICVLIFLYFLQALSIIFLFSNYAFWDWTFFLKFCTCTCQNHNNNYFYLNVHVIRQENLLHLRKYNIYYSHTTTPLFPKKTQQKLTTTHT